MAAFLRLLVESPIVLIRDVPLLVTEAFVACLLAVLFGLILGKTKEEEFAGILLEKLKAAFWLGFITLGANAILLFFTFLQIEPGYLPLHHLTPHWGRFPFASATYLVNAYLILEIAIVSTAFAAALGYVLSDVTGVFILELAGVITAIFCVAISAMPFYLFGIRNIAWALPVGMIFVGTLGIAAFTRALTKEKIIQVLLILVVQEILCTLAAVYEFKFLGLEHSVWALFIAISFIGTVGFVALGRERIQEKWVELIILVAIGAILFIIARLLPFQLFGIPNATLALVIALAFFAAIDAVAFDQAMLSSRTVHLLMVLWVIFSFVCWVGYRVAGHAGLLFISSVDQLIFWLLLYYFSVFALPLEESQTYPALRKPFSPEFDITKVLPGFWNLFKIDPDNRKLRILKSLLTYNLGTNYPYYVIEDWRGPQSVGRETPDPRVRGNAFAEFLAGPGILLTSSDHLAVTTAGSDIRVNPPGLAFTEQFEEVFIDVDLRPQLRGATVKAETKDGIGVSIFAFMPNRIWAGGRGVELNQSYPYDEESIRKAVYDYSAIEHHGSPGDAQKVRWSELVTKVGPSILKDIVTNYTCNELHMLSQDADRPRYTATPHDISPTLEPFIMSNYDETAKLQQFLLHHLDLDQMLELAFDLGVDYTLFQYRDQQTFSSQLVDQFKEKKQLDRLVNQYQKQHYNRYLDRLFPKRKEYPPAEKMQIILSDSDKATEDLQMLQTMFATYFPAKDVALVGITQDDTRVLLNLSEKNARRKADSTAESLPATDMLPFSTENFANLPTTEQDAWRFVTCEGPRTLLWEDALRKIKRDPRVEIANTFVSRLKEEMATRSIEVVGGGVSNIIVPDEVIEQRIENWKAQRELELEMMIAETKAQTAFLREEIISEVRLEMRTRLVQILQDSRAKHTRQDILATQLLDAIGVDSPETLAQRLAAPNPAQSPARSPSTPQKLTP